MVVGLKRAVPISLMRVRRTLAIVMTGCVCVLHYSRATAQELHGVITQPDGKTPAAAVIVLMLDSLADSVVSRVVSSERGYYSLKAPQPMFVRLQLLRLGQRPALVGGFSLAAQDSREVNYQLPNAPITMSTINVQRENSCQLRTSSSAPLVEVLDEALKALIASASSVSATTNTATFTRFDRQEDTRGKPVRPEMRSTSTGPTVRPFRSIDAGTLARLGYVIADTHADTSTYWAPDAEVLFSEIFLARHCLQIATGRASRPKLIGVEFHPVNRNRSLVDLRGTIWVDSATRALQSVEYFYEGLSRDFGNSGAGGRVEFTHTSQGLWFVSQWIIRMPRATMRKKNGPSLPGSGIEMEAVLDGMKITGGFVESVRSNGDLVYQRGAATIADAEPVSPSAPGSDAAKASASTTGTSGVLAGGAQRDIGQVLPPPPTGAAVSPFATPVASVASIDTVVVKMRCDVELPPDFAGIVLGRVVNADKIGISGATVVAEWTDEADARDGANAKPMLHRMIVMSVLDGSYQLCGVPFDRIVNLRAILPTRRSSLQPIKIGKSARRAEIDLEVASAKPPL